jgi:hypothetical protein
MIFQEAAAIAAAASLRFGRACFRHGPPGLKAIIDSAATSRPDGSVRCFSGSRCRQTDTKNRWDCCGNTTPAENIFRNSQNA